jgi:CheY-like chemotaxis protein/HPt (histidine-containing phosphotransfer) domain-containing protein
VEDNQVNQLVARDVLEQAGLQVVVVGDGQQALQAVAQERFDAVLMDIQMPVLDGYQATRMIRSDPANAKLPIIAMTAHALSGDREKSLASGMNDHITKPIEQEELFQALQKWVLGKTGGLLSARAQGQASPRPGPGGDQPVAPALDVALALRRLAGDRELYLMLLKEFVRSYPQEMAMLRQALQEQDTPTARRMAHTLKGVAGNISAIELARHAAALEAAIEEAVPEAWAGLLAPIEAELNKVVASCEKLLAERPRQQEAD